MATSLASQVSLPTLEKLNVKAPKKINAHEVASCWFREFSDALTGVNIDAVVALILKDGLWRDMLALTWNFRTIHGSMRIRRFLQARLGVTKISAVRLAEDPDRAPTLFNSMPGLMWVQGMFDFETAVGVGSGIFRVVPSPNGQWKAHVIYTNLEYLRGAPPKVGLHRDHSSSHYKWLDQRAKEVAFEDSDPRVLIVGAGQSGLDVAARLKYAGVPALVIEKTSRIGDIWRNRYQSLCLHDPVWNNHLAFMNFPSTWPVFPPAAKLADWLEFYANSLDLNIWTSTIVESVRRDAVKDEWIVTISRADGSKRTMRPKYVIFAIGLGGNEPNIPNIPGMNQFRGELLHSTSYKNPQGFSGRKVVVVGSATSGHDVSQDFQSHGFDVTMVQRSSTFVMSVKNALPILFRGSYGEGGPPVDLADRIGASFPVHLMKLIHQQLMLEILRLDRETIEGLERVGFKTNTGEDGSGILILAYKRAGGFYLDVGASQLIIDGKIKLKHGTIKSFSKKGLIFEDGSAIEADVVIFATGFAELHVPAGKLLGDKLAAKLKPLWRLNEEGEVGSAWGDCGLPNLYYMMGNLALCRFHSTHIALQIQAKEFGLDTTPYRD